MSDHISLPSILISYVALLFSLSFHEASHATVAYWLEDDTAARLGRMTLNPIAHMDPIGTFLFPLMGMLTGFPFIGWAKPVPIQPQRFTRKFSLRTGVAFVSAAGPVSNLLLSFVCLVITTLAIRVLVPVEWGRLEIFERALLGPELLMEKVSGSALLFLALGGRLIILNIFLAIFNMLPVGPLDGGGVLQAFLSYRAAQTFEKYKKYMFIGLILAVMIPIPGLGSTLLGWLMSPVVHLVYWVLFHTGLFFIGA